MFEQVRSAAADDPAAVARLINWAVSGAARLARAAPDVDAADRRELVARGVAELLDSMQEDSAALLGTALGYLNEQPELLPASPAQDARIRDALRVGPLPEGIDEADRAVLEHLSEQAASITGTAVLRFGGDREWGLAVGEFERVAVVRRLDDD